MTKYISLIILIQISKILSQIFSLYETSNDKIIYSSGLEAIELNHFIFSSHNSIYNNITSDLIDVDLTIPSSIEFYHNNLDFATGYPEIISMIYENDILGLQNISLNYFHNEQVFYPQKVILGKPKPLYDMISNYSMVNCSYTNMNFNPITMISDIKLNQYSKFEFFLQFTFGLYDNSIYYLNQNNSQIKFDISDCKGNVIDFFINYKVGINNKEAYLFIYNSNKNICIYSIYLESNSLKKVYINSINNINSKVNDIKSYNNEIYYSIQGETSIHQISINDTSEILNNYTYSDIENDIISFIITKQTIFFIEKEKGLYVVYKTNSSLINFFEFPYAIKLDYFFNPFTETRFVGLYNNNTDNKYSDFFIEFILSNESKPRLNKAILYPNSNKPIINQIISFDYYFTYIYDIQNSQIIVIKRGSQFNVPFSSFKINLRNYKNDYNSFIFPFYTGNDHIEVGLLDNNKFYLINEKFSPGNLTCSFLNTGIYNLIFLQKQDFCYDKLYKTDDFICINLIVYRYNVLKIKENKLITILSLIFVFIFILFFAIFAVLFRNKNQINNGMFNYKKNIDFKDNKKYLYEETGDINNKNNKKNQNVGELEDNKNNLINNNFGGINENFLNNILNNNKKRQQKGYNPHKNNNEIDNKIENEGNNNNSISENQKKNDSSFSNNNLYKSQKIEVKRATIENTDNNSLDTNNDKINNNNKSNNQIE